MSGLVRVPFHGDEIECVREGDNVWMSIPRACGNIGIAEHGQIAKLRQKTWARVQTICTPDSRGVSQDTWCLHLDSVPMWLATIEPSRVSENAREKLASYQLECARVLRDHFFGRPAPALDVQAIVTMAVTAALRAYREEETERQETFRTIGAAGHTNVRAALTTSAAAQTGETKGKLYRRVRQGLDNDLRAATGWSGTGRAWAMFPSSRWADLRVRLDEIRRAAERLRPTTQVSLTLVPGGS